MQIIAIGYLSLYSLCHSGSPVLQCYIVTLVTLLRYVSYSMRRAADHYAIRSTITIRYDTIEEINVD